MAYMFDLKAENERESRMVDIAWLLMGLKKCGRCIEIECYDW